MERLSACFFVSLGKDAMSELIGLSGALLAGYAYLPQIRHLIHERCSAGIFFRRFRAPNRAPNSGLRA